jgi:hypothetical protein
MKWYRVEFQFAYGGIYFTEPFESWNDVDNFLRDIENSEGRVRLRGVEAKDPTGWWEPVDVTAQA